MRSVVSSCYGSVHVGASEQSGSARVPVVGVGASAGGLEALERMFAAMPADVGAAYVVVQHLSPDHVSMMDELLARVTPMDVEKVDDGSRVRPNTVYVMPPGKDLILSGGRLLLTDSAPSGSERRLPIDLFFRSLAQDAGSSAVGVVLSGTGSDGSRGVAEINEVGGLVLCQDPESAQFDGMPRSALETGIVDLALPPEELPQAIATFLAHERERDAKPSAEPVLDRVLRMLREDHGVDFSLYKRKTIMRRIERRVLLRGLSDLDSYAEALVEDVEERDNLYRDLLIGVTRFYRDAFAFDTLAEHTLTDLVRGLDDDEELRVWVCACGTGEEAYTVAMVVTEAFEKLGEPVRARIFATDVHQRSLDRAAAGIYASDSLEELGEARRDRFFTGTGDTLRVSAKLRQMIVFARHDAVADPPFTRLHLVTCRNFLIYLMPATQRKLLSLFLFGLHREGALMLGRSENASSFSEELELVHDRSRIYRKRRDARLPIDLRTRLKTGSQASVSSGRGGERRLDLNAARHLLAVYDGVLNKHMPPGLLISEPHRLEHVFGDASSYLRVPVGRPTGDVLDMIVPELRGHLVGLIQRVRKSGTSLTIRSVTGPGDRPVTLGAEPVDHPGDRSLVLVTIEPNDEAPSASEPAVVHPDTLRSERITILEEELQHAKESLQATIEELETSNEEMQATNEELVASNEELQSTNEELQSVNEELYTVNSELTRKIEQLSEMTADMDHLLASMEVGTLFIDADMCVRKFTPLAAEVFHLLPRDIGRSVEDFHHRIHHDGFLVDARTAVTNGTRAEREVKDDEGNWHLLRVLPYRMDEKPAGALITLIDVGALKKAEELAREAVIRRDEFLAMLSHELRNPLSAITNAVRLAELREDKQTKAFEVVARQSDHMARILGDLLDVSRVNRNKLSFERETTSFARIVEAAIEAVEPRVAEAEIDLHLELPEGDEFLVEGDPARLRQMVSNLLDNAVKYNSIGGNVWLRLLREGDSLLLRVKDDGVGMREGRIERLFEPFVQDSRNRDRSDGGMGVGLTLVRAIANGHGGSVRAHSEGPGHGSELVVKLPACDATAPQVDTLPTMVTPQANGTTVLLVEDDPDGREMMAMLLDSLGYEVATAEDGPQAVEVFEERRPDAVILDIGLPTMSGLEVARRLRDEHGPEVPLVALSGFGRDNDRQATTAAGFDAHLVKPAKLEDLRALLSRLLDKPCS